MPHNHAAVRCVNSGHDRALGLLHRYAEDVAAAAVKSSPGGAVRAVFAGGSLAAGRVAWCAANGLEIYSDIDLYVVAADEHAADVAVAAAGAARVTPPSGARFLRAADVGVYTRADLEAQPARPGTVGLRRRRIVFYGDDTEISAMTEAIPEIVAPDEGLYLMENRVGELAMDAPASGARARLARYERVKTVLDTITAFEIAAGRFDPFRDDRRAAWESLQDSGELPAGIDRELVESALAACEDLESCLARESGPLSAERVLLLSLTVWRAVAVRVFPDASDDWATLTLRRCRAGAYKDNLREFLAMAAGRGRTRLRTAWPAARMSRYSAVSALRLGALVDAVLTRGLVDDIGRRSLDGFRAYLDRLTGVFGFEDGCLAERVAAMQRAVSGG